MPEPDAESGRVVMDSDAKGPLENEDVKEFYGLSTRSDTTEDNFLGWFAIMVAALATNVILFLFLGGVFGAATDCATAPASSMCRLWMILTLGAPIFLLGIWMVTLGIFRKRGRIYWAATAGVCLGYVAFCFFA